MKISDEILVSAFIAVKEWEISDIPDNNKIDYEFSSNFEANLDKIITSFNDDNAKNKRSAFKLTLTKVAVMLLTLSICTFSLIMSNEKARADFKNAIMEFYSTYVKFYFITNDGTDNSFSNYENIYTEYIPQGFSLSETYFEYESVGYRFENKSENLSYDIYISLNHGLSIKTDKNNLEKIKISEKDGYLVSGQINEKPYSTLIIPDNKITVTIYGQLDREEIINVGESLKEK